MDLDFKLEKVIEILDLVKKLSWGAIPLWFSLTFPIIYFVYIRLIPEDKGIKTNSSFWEKLKQLFSIPKMNKAVISFSLAMFIIGTITLMIDQTHKEKIRSNGLRMKQYFLSKNNHSLKKRSLVEGYVKIGGMSFTDIDNVLKQYPNEFIEVDDGSILLRDSLVLEHIIHKSLKLLDSYLSDSLVDRINDIDDLEKIKPGYFTREVVYKLIVDSSKKYSFCILKNGNPAIKRKSY